MASEAPTPSADRAAPRDLDEEALAAWRLPYATTPYDIWTRTNVGEVFPNVVTPLTWSVYGMLADRLLADEARLAFIPRDLFGDGLPPLLFTAIGGRLWYNAGLTHYVATERFGLPSWFYSLSLGGPREGERLHLPERRLRPLRVARAAPGILREQRRTRASVARFERDAVAMRAEVRRLRGEDLDGLDAAALLERLERVTGRAYWPYMELLDGSGAALNAFGTLAWLCERWCGDVAIANDLVTGLANLLTAQASVSLWAVAQEVHANPAARRIVESAPPVELRDRLRADPAAASVADAFARFLDDFGHRAADEFELSVPRWAEDPAFIQATLRTYLDATPAMDPSAHLRRQRQVWLAAERRARRLMSRDRLSRVVPWRWAVFRAVLKQARRYLPMRENPKHHFLLYISEIRRTALALGARLHSAGAIEQPADIFFLMRPEIERAARGREADLRPVVAAHRRLHHRFLAWDPPEVIHGDQRHAVEQALVAGPSEPWAVAASEARASPASHEDVLTDAAPRPAADGRGRLSGIAASAGVVTARARVARTPEEGTELEPGEVLVAPFTDPGWTPLFTVAGAIVMDLGGLLSHGAIVAREYGIPAVVNTRTATTTLRSGQVVTVNGTIGEVLWEEPGGGVHE